MSAQMQAKIAIAGYLVQSKLAAALSTIVGDGWLGSELKLPSSRRRWDMAYRLANKTTVVEFDGDAHYRDPLKIKVDVEKDAVAKSLGYKVVRVPYWVQLTSETLLHYFELEAEIEQDFPHGFIKTKLFPASFCELGAERFSREMVDLPETVRTAVCQSLRDRCIEHGVEYVLPKQLRHLSGNVSYQEGK
jgi:hypothetical protein